MRKTSKKFDHPTLPGLLSATSSPELAAGPSPSSLPDGQVTGQCGPAVVPASHFPLPDREKESMTSDTSGPSSPSLSASAALQQSLASRLQARLAGLGSPEYSLTWKAWAISGQEPICALRASVRRTSGSDCGGWPTPRAHSSTEDQENLKSRGERPSKNGSNLEASAQLLDGWSTPQAHDATGRSETQKEIHGSKHGCRCLVLDAKKVILGDWATPTSSKTTPQSRDNKFLARDTILQLGSDQQFKSLEKFVPAGWCSPMAQDGSRGSLPPRPQDTGVPLSKQAVLTGWPTPNAFLIEAKPRPPITRGRKPTDPQIGLADVAVHLVDSGATPSSSPAATGSTEGFQLNPKFSLWLMSFPTAWESAGRSALLSLRVQATPSSRKSQRNSSKPTSNAPHPLPLRTPASRIPDTSIPENP